MTLVVQLVALCAVLAVIRTLLRSISAFRRELAALPRRPDLCALVLPHALIARFLPRLGARISLGHDYAWRYKHAGLFGAYDKDIVTVVSVEPDVTTLLVADKAAAAHVLTHLDVFHKDEAYDALATFGPNLATLEGEAWRRHRRIIAPAFGEAAMRKTFTETLLKVDEWLASATEGRATFCVDDVVAVTSRLSLSVIAAVGFGRQVEWSCAGKQRKDGRLSLYNALRGAAHNIFLKMVIPERFVGLPFKRIKAILQPYKDVPRHFDEIVAERRADPMAPTDDILGALLSSSRATNEDEKASEAALADDELLSNLFLMLLAGFDSTAQTLTYALVCLALYPQEQLALLRDVNAVVGPDEELTYEHCSRLAYAHATVLEATRLYPAATTLPRRCNEDTSLPQDNGDAPLFAPQWSYVMVHVLGLHYNPRYWGADADVFRPSRFLDAPDGSYRWPRDAFFGWSTGPRSCIGRQFAVVELVAALCSLVRRYDVSLAEPARPGEGVEARRARVLDSDVGVVLALKRPVALVFRERKQRPI